MAHSHTHSHGPARYDQAFATGVTLNLSLVVVQIVYGVLAGSLALLTDALHNFQDVIGLGLAWGAAVLARRLPTAHYTYGLKRFSILAALANGTLLLVTTGAIVWEAIRRLMNPEPVQGGVVMIVAAVGIAVNLVSALFFLRGREHDLNIRGAFLHLMSDAAVSLGVVLAGLGIAFTGWRWIDPVVSLVIALVILFSTWGLLRDAFNLAMDAVPPGIDLGAVRNYLTSLPGVRSVHDLHVWALSTTEPALTAHLIVEKTQGQDALLSQVRRDLHDRFGIEHATLQLEQGDQGYPCQGCDAEVQPAHGDSHA
ncbi:MAG TPA: cation diffusion facilitator family transporter [Meiothermus sp.]|nr:cation diffusion facilitator family transporter [Meiothermus sp.]